jgi:hypothetical protein
MRVWVLVCVAACGGSGSGDIDAVGSGSGQRDAAVSIDAPANATAKQFCVSETNRYRAMVSKPALAENAALEAYADIGAMVDFTSSPHHHFSSTNGGGISDAENECPVQGNWMLPPGGDMKNLVGQCIAAFYAEGPGGGHYDNMMSSNTKLGCGIYMMGTGVTIIQDYGP